jgi:threonine dehydrogenase-like Zn-dependent dehydrogenase
MLGGWKFANIKDGVFAEYFHVNDAEANLAPIPDFMGAEHANISIGGTVAVFAQGPVGLMATVGARLLGAGLVIAVESVPKRQEMARHFGADIVVDYTKTDQVTEILRLTDGQGVDSAIEALGSQETFEGCVKVTRPGGTISVIGYFGKGDYVMIPRMDWGVGMSDKTIKTGLCPGGKERMHRLLRLIETGRVDPIPMTTHTFKFDELERAFRMMETKEDGMIKPLIVF